MIVNVAVLYSTRTVSHFAILAIELLVNTAENIENAHLMCLYVH